MGIKRWFSVKEKLPEREDEFLVTQLITNDGSRVVHKFLFDPVRKAWIDYDYDLEEDLVEEFECPNVIAWMEIPKPYEG